MTLEDNLREAQTINILNKRAEGIRQRYARAGELFFENATIRSVATESYNEYTSREQLKKTLEERDPKSEFRIDDKHVVIIKDGRVINADSKAIVRELGYPSNFEIVAVYYSPKNI